MRELGAGGLGAVFVARHETLGRDVALKLMHADLAARPEHRLRFEREARALAQLRHPNIVTVLDFGVEDETTFLVMELAEGTSLDRFLAAELPSIDTAIAIVRQLLRALAYAHAQKIVHRDLKPANLVVHRSTGGAIHLVVLDFGIAKILEDEGDVGLTKQGAILGTPAYMAPEQASGGKPRPSLDVYAAGLVAFELFTGRRPFVDSEPGALLRAQLTAPPPIPTSLRPDLASVPGLDGFLLRALEKKPANRFEDASRMLDAFEQLVEARTADSAPARTSGIVAPVGPSPMPRETAPSVASEPGGVAVRTIDRRFVLGVVGLVGLLGVAGLVVTLVREGSGDRASEAFVPPQAPLVLPSIASSPSGGPAGPLARGVPQELAELHHTILAGSQPSRFQLQAFYRYNAAHRGDARGLLILGWTCADRRWYSDAIDAYREACSREPSSAEDARLRSDLVRFSGMDRFAGPAGRAVESCLGPSAVPDVEAAMAGAPDAEAKHRYGELRARLRGDR